MPCDVILRKMAEEEKRRVEQERNRALREIEDAMAKGIAKIVKLPNGQFRIVGAALPTGMYDLCTLAKLQQRNSEPFKRAMAQAQAHGANFVHQHNLAHQRGGHRH
jgi:hypothetical protein